MDLFSISRHGCMESLTNERSKLDAVLKRIEKNKLITSKRKTRTCVQVNDHVNTEEQDEPINKIQKLDDDLSIAEQRDEDEKHIPKPVEDSELGFTILGMTETGVKQHVKRVLPKWLAKPTVISTNLSNLELKTSDLKLLDKGLRKLLKANKVEYFFPVQAVVVPWILETHKHSNVLLPRDICVSSPTGSGKTLSFVLPVVQVLKQYIVKSVRAIVILPTQDLAQQVFQTFKKYTQNTHLSVALVTGYLSFQQEQKQLVCKNEGFGYVAKFDIIVCTPGRLVDHLKLTKGFDLQHLEFLIIDEADRVLNSMQNDWLYHLEKHIYSTDSAIQPSKLLNLYSISKQKVIRKLLFSATLSQDPEKLQQLSLFQPQLFTSIVESDDQTNFTEETNNGFIGKYTTPKELIEKYIVCSSDLKPLVLYQFITRESLNKILVFTHSVESVHRLSVLLRSLSNNSLTVEEISSHLPSKTRNEIISRFSQKEIDILVCTDALARGMDLPKVECVISYSMPKYIKTYIHRAGRTARAGESGVTLTILQENQVSKFKSLLKEAGKINIEEVFINEDDLEPLGDQYKEALQSLKKTVESENKKQLKKVKHVKNPFINKT